MLSEDVLFSSVRELGRLLKTKQISPVELAESYLARLESIGPKLGAVVTVTGDLALDQARAAQREIMRGRYRGPLHGIPYGAKDLLATRGIPTTWGAAPFRNQVFDYDATVIARLREAGAVLVAKLAMVELAGGLGYNNPDASFTGPGRTPWNTGYWSGGSSSGSAAATAAALVGFAIGSETSGSILTPASCCGLSAIRPTYGLVSRHGAMALCWTLDKLGPLGRTIDDCALVLEAIAGADPADSTTVSRRFTYRGPEAAAGGAAGRRPRKVRLGVPKGVIDRAQPEVRTNFEKALEALAPVAEITRDVELPDFPGVVGTIVRAEGAAAFRDLIEGGRTRELQDPHDRTGGYAMMATLAVDYLHAMRLRAPMRRAYAEIWKRVDGLIAPNRGSVAPPIGRDFETPPPAAPAGARAPAPPSPPSLVPTGNAIGAPAVAMMTGLGQHGLPTSMQVMGAPFSEQALIAIGNAYQRVTDWHTRRPPIRGDEPARAGLVAHPVPWEEML